MKKVDYKKNILKKICQTNQIEYKEEEVKYWTRYYSVGSEKEYQRIGVYMPPEEVFEANIVEILLRPLILGGSSINEKVFFEEYVVKMIFRYCEDDEQNWDEVIIFVKNDLLDLGVRLEERDKFVVLTDITTFFDIYFKANEYKKYEYSSLTNSVYAITDDDKMLLENKEYEKGMLFFDSKSKKYILWYGENFCPLDASYISFVKGDDEFVPTVYISYFVGMYFTMLNKKTEKEHDFLVEDTEENVKKIKRIIVEMNNPFTICDYKENHYYIKCLSGEDDELLFRLHL